MFLKIENDGFDLGAQRREIDKNDLPLALQILEEYKESLNYDFTDSSDIMAEIEKEFFQKLRHQLIKQNLPCQISRQNLHFQTIKPNLHHQTTKQNLYPQTIKQNLYSQTIKPNLYPQTIKQNLRHQLIR